MTTTTVTAGAGASTVTVGAGSSTVTLSQPATTVTLDGTSTTVTASTASATAVTGSVATTVTASTASATAVTSGSDSFAKNMPVVQSLKIAGHSYLPDAPSYLSSAEHGVSRRLRALFGTRDGYLNSAVAGGAAASHNSSSSWSKVVTDVAPVRTTKPWVADAGLVVVNYGTNDAILGTSATDLAGYRAAMQTIFSRYCASSCYWHDAASVTVGANWTDTAHGATPIGGGVGNYVSSTVGAVLTIAVPSTFTGGYVGIVFPGSWAGGTATVAVDGVGVGTVTTGNLHASIYSSKWTAATFRALLTTGAHTITVTVASLINAGSVYVNGWHIEADASPPIAVLENVLPTRPSGVWSSIDQATVNAYNVELRAAIAAHNAASPDSPVFLVPLDAVIAANAAYFVSDGLHPNAAGAALMASAVHDAVHARIRVGSIKTTDMALPSVTADPEVRYSWLRSDWDVRDWVEDTFTRVDSAVALGTGESGHTWTTTGTMGITSKAAYAPGAAGRTFATTDTASPDGEWIVNVGNNGGGDLQVGAVMRYVDPDNYVFVAAFPSFVTFGVYMRRNGSDVLVTNTGFSGSVGEVKIRFEGSRIRVWQDGAAVVDTTDGRFLQFRSSRHGFYTSVAAATVTYVTGKHYTPVATDWISNHMHLRPKTAAYALVAADNDRVVEIDSASPVTVTVPTSAVVFPTGARVDVLQVGTGAVSVAGDTGVTVRTSSTLVLAQYQRGSLIKRSSTEWIFSKWS